ncbi:hypothetical protein [Haloglomus litoreum]|uniref:hypothetical protein n=1 Tax=Haloglomus litoreum TaxID=3034026 RepID=UPI0023E86CC1|nr:hypothetical protein [Haloglomus sp. DT116]
MPSNTDDRRFTRRQLLAASGATALAGLAGCTLTDSPQVRCASTGEGGGDTILTFRVTPGDRYAYLLVGVPASEVPDGLEAIRVSDGADRLLYEIPVQDNADMNRWRPPGIDEEEVPYTVNLGEPPVHGSYRVQAVSDGTVVATATLEFNCFVDAPR